MIRTCLVPLLQVLVASLAMVEAVHAQDIFAQPIAGVEIDAGGVVRLKAASDPTGNLTRTRLLQARAALNPELARPSPLRKVSLNRLEAELKKLLEQHADLPNELRYLAGLTRVEYVLVYPESGDVVIAGPAEGFGSDLSGRPIGIESGHAVLELQDLIVALRAFPPGEPTRTAIGCSIDPTPAGLQRMQQYIAASAGRVTPADAQAYALGMVNALGTQQVSVMGISPKTHFAQVLVEADYRMKLIGIGLETPAVRIQSFIEKATPTEVSRNAMQRWFFVPDYEAVKLSADSLAMQLVGPGVKLISEDELVSARGDRVQSRKVNRASQAFARSFTQQYAQLAKVSPIYGQLRNVVDLSIVAAFLQQYDIYGKVRWQPQLLADESRLTMESYPAPKEVESAVNVVWKGNTLMTPIGGGVDIQASQAFDSGNLHADEEGEIAQLRQGLKLPGGNTAAWWWD